MPKLSHDTQVRRRTHILDSAEACFARRGFHRTTMQDICRQAKVSAGALYVYFDSKEALIDGLVERDREGIVVLLQQIGSAPDFFVALEGALRACVIDRPASKAALYVEMVAEAHRNSHVAQSLSTCDVTLQRVLGQLLMQARAEGHVGADVDAGKIATLMMMIGDALFMRRAINPAFDSEKLVPELLHMIKAVMAGGVAAAADRPPLLSLKGAAE